MSRLRETAGAPLRADREPPPFSSKTSPAPHRGRRRPSHQGHDRPSTGESFSRPGRTSPARLEAGSATKMPPHSSRPTRACSGTGIGVMVGRLPDTYSVASRNTLPARLRQAFGPRVSPCSGTLSLRAVPAGPSRTSPSLPPRPQPTGGEHRGFRRLRRQGPAPGRGHGDRVPPPPPSPAVRPRRRAGPCRPPDRAGHSPGPRPSRYNSLPPWPRRVSCAACR